MRPFLRTTVPTGIVVAAASALLGYGLASFAGPFADAQVGRGTPPGELPSDRMKVRIPLVMAALSFTLLVALEGLAALGRSRRAALPPETPAAPASGMDAEVEALLNQILTQAENQPATSAPPVGEPRSLSTTH